MKFHHFERKFWISEEGYHDNPTSFSGFAAKMMGFQSTSRRNLFIFVFAVRI